MPSDARRLVAGLVAVGAGLLAPLVAEEILAHRLGLEGPPVVYGSVALTAVGTAAAVRHAGTRSWRTVLLYGVLAVGGVVATFVYLFSQTQA